MKFSLILTALLSTFIQQGYAYGDRSGICTDDAQAMSASVMGGTNNPALGWT
jgi:hypothetical protein